MNDKDASLDVRPPVRPIELDVVEADNASVGLSFGPPRTRKGTCRSNVNGIKYVLNIVGARARLGGGLHTC